MSLRSKMTQNLYWMLRHKLARRGIQMYRGANIMDYLVTRDIDVVLDVGANEGQFAHELRRWGYKGRIISFEPISDVFDILRKNTELDPKWEARRLAVGDVSGEIVINVSKISVFSSVLPLTDLALDHSEGTQVVREEVVQLVRLDDIFGEFEGHNVFLKVDTQGFEAQVISGGHASLQKIAGVQLELPIEHLYAGVWDLNAALSAMKDNNFVVAQAGPVSQLVDDRASAIELDCLFRPSSRHPLLMR